VNVGDLRVGTRVRLVGHADRDRFSLHLGVGVAVPTGNRDTNTGDGTARVEPRVIAAGRAAAVRWSASLAWMSRPNVDGGGVIVGDELRANLGVGLALTDEQLHVGLETSLFTTVRELPRTLGEGNAAFTRGAWGMELLLGARYTFLRALAVGAAAGVGLEQAAELLHLIARWVHLIAGIMWIGNSMLFNWLDRNLEKRPTRRRGTSARSGWSTRAASTRSRSSSRRALPEDAPLVQVAERRHLALAASRC
jgi:hypothetical protein